MVTPGTLNEASTRAALIDAQLARAGWSKSRRNLVEEVVVVATEPTSAWDHGNQFADYVLLGSDNKPIAVVEAKRSSRDELAGKRQAEPPRILRRLLRLRMEPT
jgi:type I restriction enzyme R subunit